MKFIVYAPGEEHLSSFQIQCQRSVLALFAVDANFVAMDSTLAIKIITEVHFQLHFQTHVQTETQKEAGAAEEEEEEEEEDTSRQANWAVVSRKAKYALWKLPASFQEYVFELNKEALPSSRDQARLQKVQQFLSSCVIPPLQQLLDRQLTYPQFLFQWYPDLIKLKDNKDTQPQETFVPLRNVFAHWHRSILFEIQRFRSKTVSLFCDRCKNLVPDIPLFCPQEEKEKQTTTDPYQRYTFSASSGTLARPFSFLLSLLQKMYRTYNSISLGVVSNKDLKKHVFPWVCEMSPLLGRFYQLAVQLPNSKEGPRIEDMHGVPCPHCQALWMLPDDYFLGRSDCTALFQVLKYGFVSTQALSSDHPLSFFPHEHEQDPSNPSSEKEEAFQKLLFEKEKQSNDLFYVFLHDPQLVCPKTFLNPHTDLVSTYVAFEKIMDLCMSVFHRKKLINSMLQPLKPVVDIRTFLQTPYWSRITTPTHCNCPCECESVVEKRKVAEQLQLWSRCLFLLVSFYFQSPKALLPYFCLECRGSYQEVHEVCKPAHEHLKQKTLDALHSWACFQSSERDLLSLEDVTSFFVEARQALFPFIQWLLQRVFPASCPHCPHSFDYSAVFFHMDGFSKKSILDFLNLDPCFEEADV